MSEDEMPTVSSNDIAIVGMAAHLPGCPDVRTYWRKLIAGEECISEYTDEELEARGVGQELLRHPNYVKRGAPVPEMADFDAEFFGFSPKEAAILDPQHRHFLEVCWESLEDAGWPPSEFEGAIGVFGGCGHGTYMTYNLLTRPELVDEQGFFLLRHTGNDKDFLATRVAYVFDLKGPAVSVQTACSTSLTAVHVAAQSLISGECDMALAGGSTIEQPHGRGYLYKENEILAPDGRCRAFDASAQGTVFGSGAGAVVLRRLSDALADGDRVYAVIKGSAINNDGAQKVSYLAPSVEGQAAAVAEALDISGVSPESIGYIESHGTGTPMGDPIEISALTQAYRKSTQRKGYCGIGSVKTNIGHLDTAAGVAGLIKASLSLYHRKLAPTLHFDTPNPECRFEDSPFYVVDKLVEWEAPEAHPRRAAVNSLGVGGTNAHLVLEEPPAEEDPTEPARQVQLLKISARHRDALDRYCDRLADHLEQEQDPPVSLPDVAYTLDIGRRAFDQRMVVACSSAEEAAQLLRSRDPKRVFKHTAVAAGKAQVAFMFAGGGSQYAGMGQGLYESEPVYREWIDRGKQAFEALRPDAKGAFDRLMFPSEADREAADEELHRPSLQLPFIFIVEYALAQLWMEWGVEPSALVGHSMGENTAACLAGVMSFDECLGLVSLRGQLFERVPAGGMLSVPLSRQECEAYLGDVVDLASVNGPSLCAFSGPNAALEKLAARLLEQDIEARRIKIDIAAHSRMLEPILGEFHAYLSTLKLKPPTIPFVSNRTGTWVTDAQATSAQYWVEHLRGTVLFSECVQTLLNDPGRVFLEVGPGKTLSSLVRQQPTLAPSQSVLNSLRHPDEVADDETYFVTALGRAWASGVPVATEHLRGEDELRLRVSLPNYAFLKKRYYFEPGLRLADEGRGAGLSKMRELEDWLYTPSWSRRAARPSTQDGPFTWLVFLDETELGKRVVKRLRGHGHRVITVVPGDMFHRADEDQYLLAPEHGREGYAELVRELAEADSLPDRVLHLWLLTQDESFRPGSSFFHRNQEYGFYGVLLFAQALVAEGVERPMHLSVVTNGAARVHQELLPYPDKATVLGALRVIPRELPQLTAAAIDVQLPRATRRRRFAAARYGSGPALDVLVDQLLPELLGEPESVTVAYRGGARFVAGFEHAGPALRPDRDCMVRDGGTYLLTGGLGGLGLLFAEYLARSAQANLVLVSRSGLPPRESWDEHLARHGQTHPVSRRIERVRAIEALGSQVMLASASCMDLEDMEAVVAQAEQRFGRVHGVLHTAGVLRDGLIPMKTSTDIEEVFGPKVHGTRVLDQVFTNRDLDFMVLFSSTSADVAPAGQVDYVAANAFLNAYAQSCAGQPRQTVAVHWGVWNEVGMAADAAVQMGALERPPESLPVSHPWFAERIRHADGRTEILGELSPQAHWVLDEHRTAKGHALMPGTGYLELARAVIAELAAEHSLELDDLLFMRPFYVPDGEKRRFRLHVVPTDDGYSLDIQSQRELSDGRKGWETHAQAQLIETDLEPPAAIEVKLIEERCNLERTPEDPQGMRSEQEDHLLFGPRWRVLRQVSYGAGEAIAKLQLPDEFIGDLAGVPLHPGLMDFATGYAMRLIDGYAAQAQHQLWVPLSYGRARFYAGLTPQIRSWVRLRTPATVTSELASFDVRITDPEGRLLVEIQDFTIKRLALSEADFAVAAEPTAKDLELPGTGSGGLSPAEAQFQYNLERGILPDEGTALFERILRSAPEPEVVVSSLDLYGLIAQAESSLAATDDDATKFERPDLDNDYVAPSDELERTLVGFFEEILGVSGVGLNDSFFDLGGHSLIAVRLFAKIKKAFEVEYPISVLFEAPTVGRISAMLREVVHVEADADGKGSEEVPRRRSTAGGAAPPSFKHLVAMHSGTPGPNTPFFLVAGMFGNVLNLRHLASLVGRDRPFYGVQARGLLGDDQPHESFEEMARDYLAEVRRVQPHGPYMLGGFSGGGVAAYEMAQQLIAEGEEVAMLVMLDTPLPHPHPIGVIDKLEIHSQRLRREGTSYFSTWARDRYEWELDRIRARMAGAPEVGTTPSFRSNAIRAAFDRSCARYRLAPFGGTLTLCRPKLPVAYVLRDGRVLNSDREVLFQDNGWGPYVHEVDVVEVPGDHDSMVLEPQVRTLARALTRRMEAFEFHRPYQPLANGAARAAE